MSCTYLKSKKEQNIKKTFYTSLGILAFSVSLWAFPEDVSVADAVFNAQTEVEKNACFSELENIRRELDELRAQTAQLSAIAQDLRISQTLQDARERSGFFASVKYLLTVPVNSGSSILQGYEYEFGGSRRGRLVFTGTTSFFHAANKSRRAATDTIRVYDWYDNFSHIEYRNYEKTDLSLGWGAGAFFGQIISVGENFGFAPGLSLGYWFYLNRTIEDYTTEPNKRSWRITGGFEHYWGGPDIRAIIGRRAVSFELFYKMQLGSVNNWGRRQHNKKDGLNIRNLWGAGINFSALKKTRKQEN